ncbi:carboxypeptidase-like regulatory domain-containing protein [Brevibacillus humidisoli]|uniref:carboxypeptidase-like regulatory domain-containing protein n=1 Tax=Brevibacillus humidisoli TaxID=2895522 RepID=UPI001E54B1E9|nr:carboxypeptidase-like regulatory domain-containing protein [Brevibacillus humidisoli]UFJ42540.1 carboxypeptidase-like regulatory domain-containing protein [Brevibacillus humidisoli]
MIDDEFTGRYQDGWVSRRFVLPLRHIKKESPLIIHGRRFPYPKKLTISVYVNGTLIQQAVNPDSKFTIRAVVPPMIRGTLEIVASDYFVPKEKGINEDVRKLCFYLDEVLVPGLPDLMEPYVHLFDFKPSKKVYFLDDDVWDLVSYMLSDNYKIPFRKMMNPLKETEWWESVKPVADTSIQGTVYHKFSGLPLQEGEVQLLDGDKQLVMQTVIDDKGTYSFKEVVPGDYLICGSATAYGEQQIRIRKDNYGKVIHIPMLPLV